MRMAKILLVAMFMAAAFAACGIPAAAADAASTLNPWAQLIVNRDDAKGSIELVITTHGKPGGDTKVIHTAPDGVAILTRFDAWYEDLFSLTYASSDYKRLWKQVRQRGAGLAKDFITPEMLSAIEGCALLLVVDDVHPFPADTFRIGDRWLFEIAPIIHSSTPGPKDLTDSYKYKDVLVLDCQGPKDREGQEAPGVSKNLSATPGAAHKMLISLTREGTIKILNEESAGILHLATHAYPDEFFPGRNKPGIKTDEFAKYKLKFHTVLSTGCNSGNPVFARAMLNGDVRFYIASMYVTSGKDGIIFGDAFYRALFSGRAPFQAFYDVKANIAGSKSDFPDILRFAFFVR